MSNLLRSEQDPVFNWYKTWQILNQDGVPKNDLEGVLKQPDTIKIIWDVPRGGTAGGTCATDVRITARNGRTCDKRLKQTQNLLGPDGGPRRRPGKTRKPRGLDDGRRRDRRGHSLRLKIAPHPQRRAHVASTYPRGRQPQRPHVTRRLDA